MDPYFLADISDGNIGFVMPFWAWLILIPMIVILCFRWGHKVAIKNQLKRFRKKFFGDKNIFYSDRLARETTALGQGYIVVNRIAKMAGTKFEEDAPVTLWQVINGGNGERLWAIPVEGYVPKERDAVCVLRWICEEFDSEAPAVIYFIRPVKEQAQAA